MFLKFVQKKKVIRSIPLSCVKQADSCNIEPSEIIYLKINNNWTTRTSFVEKLCALYIDDSPRKNEDHSRAVKSRIPIELGGKKICTFGCCGTSIAVDGSK